MSVRLGLGKLGKSRNTTHLTLVINFVHFLVKFDDGLRIGSSLRFQLFNLSRLIMENFICVLYMLLPNNALVNIITKNN
jgi:hypothetical protein